ncbi:hypothetical protein DPEC_G00251160 [Dallia pectoralis]|uniref:Uncharacterized protein n=1 Tax=Dallia pectoralis TaxID=75939 RepID=A0ACC2FTB7_DALPE|nr:hypothetical protein DPEC_G00251160 [Dallia pectoralis]
MLARLCKVDFRYKNTHNRCDYTSRSCSSGDCGYSKKDERRQIDGGSRGKNGTNNRWCETETVETRIIPSDLPFQMIEKSGLESWSRETQVDLGRRSDTSEPNRSPVTGILPFIRVAQNCPRTYNILAFDPDSDRVRYRLTNPKGFHLDQADTTTPEADLPTPEADTTTPEADLRPTPEADLPTPEADLPTPEADLPTPEADLPTPEADLPTPEADLPTPEADLPTPEADLPTPEADLPTPEADTTTPEADLPTPEDDLPTPEADLPTPEADLPTPEADLTTPEADLPTPEADLPTPEADLPTPEANLPTPEADTTTPEADLPTPEDDTTTPEADLPTPEADTTTPEADLPTLEDDTTTPEADLPTPEDDLPTPEADLTTPEADPTTTAATTPEAATTTAPTTYKILCPFTFPLSKLPLHFLILVDSYAPSCDEGKYLRRFVNPTPHNGERIHAEVNKELEIRIRAVATHSEVDDVIITGPLNISKHITTHKEFVIRWTPDQDDLGQYFPICFIAEGESGSRVYQSEMRCVLVEVEKQKVSLASADHFYGGSTSFTPRGNGSFKVDFRYKNTHDWCDYTSQICSSGDCGYSERDERGQIDTSARGKSGYNNR